MIFSAIYCLLGHGFSNECIRKGEPFSELEAVFTIEPNSDNFLLELTDQEPELIIYRKKISNKSPITKINNKSVSQKTLKQIASHIAIYINQHEQLSLMKPSYQLSLKHGVKKTRST